MKFNKKLTVVITGAANGIGRALALECHQRGYSVYATDIDINTMRDMHRQNLHTLKLDVNSSEDIQKLLERLSDDGVIPDLLINNAGFGPMAPLMDLPHERLKLQFETNVFSVVALCQAIVPLMVNYGSGRIVNIGSVSGVMTTPFAGAYCATKAAVHSLSDALRMELKPFGIDVLVVMPSSIRSNFGNAAASAISKGLKVKSLYAPIADAIAERAMMSQQSKSINSEEFARLMMDSVTAKHPASIIGIGPGGFLLPFTKRFVPLSLIDRMLMSKFKLNRLKVVS